MINFPFGTNGKLIILGVPILKHITVRLVSSMTVVWYVISIYDVRFVINAFAVMLVTSMYDLSFFHQYILCKVCHQYV